MVVNHPAGAILLALAAVAAGREVIVSRGQVVEMGGCRLAEIFARSGAILREVGTTNQTRLDDYAAAIGERTAALALITTDDFATVGRTAAVPLEELVALGLSRRVPVIHAMGSAPLVDLVPLGIAEPSVTQSLRAGADLVLVDGNGLLGGPPCAMILGRRTVVERIDAHPLAPAFAAGRITLAALAATLRLYQDSERFPRAVPILHLLATSVENLKNRAERMAPQMASAAAVAKAEPVAEVTYLRGVPIPVQQTRTWCVAIEVRGTTVERFAATLRGGKPAVLARVEQGRLLVDLRSVIPRQDQELVAAVCAAGNSAAG